MTGIRIPTAIGFAAVGLFLCWLIPKARWSSKTIAKNVYWMLVASTALVFSNLVQELSISARLSYFAYCVFFLSMSALIYALVRFSMAYTAYPQKRPLWLKVIEVLVLIDACSLVINLLTHHAYGIREVYAATGEMFYAAVYYLPFRLHLYLLYALIVLSFAMIIRKLVITPREYRNRYLLLLGIFILMVLWDGLFIVMRSVINYSVFGYAGLNALIYYFSLVYIPRGLLDHLHARIVNGLNEGIMFFDTDNKCVYANDRALQFVGAKTGDYEACGNFVRNWCEEEELDFTVDNTVQKTVENGIDKAIYEVECKHLYDNRERHVGSIFSFRDRTEEIRNFEEQKYLATHDVLTGILNRRGFMESAEKLIELKPGPYSMVCTDIRDFKFINDLFGADRGDEILQKTAKLYEGLCGKDEICGRLNADRFALLMKTNSFDDAALLDTMNEISGMVVSSAYSIFTHAGVYEITDKDTTVPIMCDRANMAAATIRSESRNLIVYYNEDLKEESLHEKQVLNDFEEALKNKEFRIYLQPQFSADGAIVGAEALVRWFQPERGLQMPGSFVPTLERAGMIYRLDREVWELAVQQLAAWTGTEKEFLTISVNISSKDLYYIDLYGVFTGLVEQYHVDPARLKLEITETALMKDIGAYNSLFARLHAYGFEVEMDDFGSGYSSLSMLKDIHVDILKIDMAFLQRTESAERGKIILRAMIALAKDLHMPVITEGVETREQMEFLKDLGCDMFQGYYFSKPITVEQLEEKYFPGGAPRGKAYTVKDPMQMEAG